MYASFVNSHLSSELSMGLFQRGFPFRTQKSDKLLSTDTHVGLDLREAQFS